MYVCPCVCECVCNTWMRSDSGADGLSMIDFNLAFCSNFFRISLSDLHTCVLSLSIQMTDQPAIHSLR